ncbi:MAG: CPBP family intramembrane metalloprotease [Actinomycetia bacterium]|nr:CPBP family intramembrane metalloprotease [Actinomycetes bacterium]
MSNVKPSGKKSFTTFFLLTFIISLPFYALSGLASQEIIFPKEMGFVSVFTVVFAPMAAALILVSREQGWSNAKKLLGRSFDYKRISSKIWYLPILFLVPLLFILALGLLVLMGKPIPTALASIFAIPVLVPIFFILASGEEIGWMGYAFEPMQAKWGALGASFILGAIWALWHLPLYISLEIGGSVFMVASGSRISRIPFSHSLDLQ